MLAARGVEGFITIDTSITEAPSLPTVAIAGHTVVAGVTNINLDEKVAARSILTHLLELGHRDIAFIKGHANSSDSATRWAAICAASKELGIRIRPELVAQIKHNLATPHLGYPYAKELLAQKHSFTALVAYNDLAAVGAVMAFREAGLNVPQDISVVGFDDVPAAVFSNPELTTVRQPLHRMGQIAAKILIDRIERKAEFQPRIVIEPNLIVRASTGPAPTSFSREVDSKLAHAIFNGGSTTTPRVTNSRRRQDGRR